MSLAQPSGSTIIRTVDIDQANSTIPAVASHAPRPISATKWPAFSHQCGSRGASAQAALIVRAAAAPASATRRRASASSASARLRSSAPGSYAGPSCCCDQRAVAVAACSNSVTAMRALPCASRSTAAYPRTADPVAPNAAAASS